jgi:multidrug resistance efflux pump
MPATFSRTLRSLEVDDRRRRGIALLAGALAISWAAWFLVARVPVYEVAETARLEVEAAAHPVAPQVDGRVLATNLAIGREVLAGEVLVVLDAEQERLAIQERRTRRDGLVAKLEAHRKQIGAEREVAATHHAARTVATGELRAKADEAEARAKFADLQLNHLSALRARRAVAQEEYDRARAEAEALHAGVRTNRLAMERLESERAVQQGDRRARITALEAAEVELRGDIATEEAAIRRLEHTVDLRHVRAPLSGRVGEVAPEFRVGSVARAGERLGAIVPPGVPRGVALFPAAAAGRIRPEQPARLRLHGFPWTQYGTVPAHVAHVGDEARAGLIRVELDLRPDPRSPIPVAHGLPGTVEVEVERVTPAVLVLRATGRYLAARRTPALAPGLGAGP